MNHNVELTPFLTVMRTLTDVSCVCRYPFRWCSGCPPWTNNEMLVKKVAWDKLSELLSADDLHEIILPSNANLDLARFLEGYFQKPVVFTLPQTENPRDSYYHEVLWERITNWDEDEAKYFFERLQKTWAEVLVSTHVNVAHPNQALVLKIFLERGVEFPEDYFVRSWSFKYHDINELIVLSRPNIDRSLFIGFVLRSNKPIRPFYQRSFYRELLQEMTNFEWVATVENLEFVLDENLIPRTEEQFETLVESIPMSPDFLRIIVDYWDPEVYRSRLDNTTNDPLFALELYVQVIISGKDIFTDEQMKSEFYQAAQRIAEVRSQKFGTKIKRAYHIP